MKLYPFQKEMLKNICSKKFVVSKGRCMGLNFVWELYKKFTEAKSCYHYIQVKNGFIWENGKALGVSKSDKIAYVNNLLYKEVFIFKYKGKKLVLDENYKIKEG